MRRRRRKPRSESELGRTPNKGLIDSRQSSQQIFGGTAEHPNYRINKKLLHNSFHREL